MAQDAWAALSKYLGDLGLTSLLPLAQRLIAEGASPDRIDLELQQTPEWKQRFFVIEQRRAAGLPPVTVPEVLAYEQRGLELAQAYGLPKALLSRETLGNLMLNDVSLVELENRIQSGYARLNTADPQTQETFRQLYGMGLSAGELAAYVLAPDITLPEIEKRVAASQIGGVAAQTGLSFSSSFLEQLAQAGVAPKAAQQVFGTLARNRSLVEQLAGELAPALSQEQVTRGLLGMNGADTAAVEQRKSGLAAVFGGGAGGAGGAQASQEGVVGLR